MIEIEKPNGERAFYPLHRIVSITPMPDSGSGYHFNIASAIRKGEHRVIEVSHWRIVPANEEFGQ